MENNERKEIFNFYIEPSLKKDVQSKLYRLVGELNKGTMSALIRVYLRLFVATPDDKINPKLLESLLAEYEFSTRKNKRSTL